MVTGTWLLFSISYSYMGCHPSHWRTPSFFKMVIAPATSEIACLKHSILSTNIATLIFQGSISRQSADTYAFFRWKPSRLPVGSNTPGRLSFSGRVHDFLCQDIVQYPWIEHIVSTYISSYLVGGLDFFFSIYWEFHHPNCYSLHHFSEG